MLFAKSFGTIENIFLYLKNSIVWMPTCLKISFLYTTVNNCVLKYTFIHNCYYFLK
jgi:hypothetical protein